MPNRPPRLAIFEELASEYCSDDREIRVTQPEHVQTRHPYRKLGRLPEDPRKPRLQLKHYLKAAYKGSVPDVVDYSGKVATWPMYLNDRLGDCTAADAGHGVQQWTAWGQGQPVTVGDNDVEAFYSGSTGYDSQDPSTDQGGTMQEVNDYFRKTGLAGHSIEAFFRVDTDDLDEVRAALYLFGCVSVGMAFPGFAMDQFEAGQPWHVQNPRPRNYKIEGGHDVLVVAARKGGNLTVVTWGRLQEVTPAFWMAYMGSHGQGEAWARVETDWAAKTGVSPANALTVDQLNDAFQQLTGHPGPFVAPVPAPGPPAPVPPLPPTRAEIIRQLAADLDNASAKLRLLAGDYE
jgi:hypothetical protein